jgi:hypothetical protein
MVLGLAFSVAVFAGRTSVAAAKFDEGGSGARYVSAGGWSGEVDMESGVPVSAGIPEGDEQFIDSSSPQVIPYLSHGLLTQADADAAAAEAIHDPYLTDVFVRPGESLGGADGRSPQEWTVVPYLSHGILGESVKSAPLNRVERALEQNPQVIPYLSHGTLTETDAQALAAEAIADPNLARLSDAQPRPDGDEVAMAHAIASQQFVPGVTDFPTTTPVESPAVRPDDVADRFAHSDVPAEAEVASSSTGSGSTIEWNEALTAGIGALVLVLGLGLAFGYLKRPKLAGL